MHIYKHYFILLFLSFGLIISNLFIPPLLAANPEETSIVLMRLNGKVDIIDLEVVEYEKDKIALPLMVMGKILDVPIIWSKKDKIATFYRPSDGLKCEVHEGAKYLLIGEQLFQVDFPPLWIEKDLFVPLEFIEKGMEVELKWSFSEQAVIATCSRDLKLLSPSPRGRESEVAEKKEESPPQKKTSFLSLNYFDYKLSHRAEFLKETKLDPLVNYSEGILNIGTRGRLFGGNFDFNTELATSSKDFLGDIISSITGKLRYPIFGGEVDIGDSSTTFSQLTLQDISLRGIQVGIPKIEGRITYVSPSIIKGKALEGSTVELWVNDIFTAKKVVGKDGIYEFSNIFLLMGDVNKVEIFITNPQGEKRKIVKKYLAIPEILNRGESRLSISGGLIKGSDEKDYSRLLYGFRYLYGISKDLTLGSIIVSQEDKKYMVESGVAPLSSLNLGLLGSWRLMNNFVITGEINRSNYDPDWTNKVSSEEEKEDFAWRVEGFYKSGRLTLRPAYHRYGSNYYSTDESSADSEGINVNGRYMFSKSLTLSAVYRDSHNNVDGEKEETLFSSSSGLTLNTNLSKRSKLGLGYGINYRYDKSHLKIDYKVKNFSGNYSYQFPNLLTFTLKGSSMITKDFIESNNDFKKDEYFLKLSQKQKNENYWSVEQSLSLYSSPSEESESSSTKIKWSEGEKERRPSFYAHLGYKYNENPDVRSSAKVYSLALGFVRKSVSQEIGYSCEFGYNQNYTIENILKSDHAHFSLGAEYKWGDSGLEIGLKYTYNFSPITGERSFGGIRVALNQGLALSGAEETLSDDLPIVPSGKVKGKVFLDYNHNGIMDENEPGVPGIKVGLFHRYLQNSDKEGNFYFPRIPVGVYKANIDLYSLPASYSVTTPPVEIEVKLNETVIVNLGIIPVVSITGRVFLDENKNGIYDKGEKVGGGIRLVLDDGKRDTYTDPDGSYYFGEVFPGEHIITVDLGTFSKKVKLVKKSIKINVPFDVEEIEGIDFPVQLC